MGYIWDEDAPLSSVLSDVRAEVPLDGFAVSFTLGTASAAWATDAAGTAAGSVHLGDAPGWYTASASFAGDDHYGGSTDSAGFGIGKRPILVEYTGDTSGYWSENAVLSGTLTDAIRRSPLAGFQLDLWLG